MLLTVLTKSLIKVIILLCPLLNLIDGCRKPIQCSDYASYIGDGYVSCTNYNYEGSNCYYSCYSNYELVGATILYCKSNGDWDNPKPECNVNKCSDYASYIANGYVSCTNYNYVGSKCYYYCDRSYKLDGVPYMYCELDGEWDANKPKCKGFTTCGNRPFDHKDIFSHTRVARSPDDVKQHGFPVSGVGYHSSKIIGGRVATHGSIPWQARLSIVVNSNEFQHQCGGIVISEYFVLTAAHCFKNVRESHLRVVVGEHSITKHDEGEQTFGVEKIIMHDDYDNNTYNNDIALLKVKPVNGKGIQFNDFVQPACLPRWETEYTAGTTCLISGWGNMKQQGSYWTSNAYPNVLMEADAPLIADDICEARMSRFNRSNMVCAGYMSGEMDTCDGDSGGPLVCHMKGSYTVLGVTSWGVGCGLRNLPGVYTRVKEFLPWIYDQIKGYSNSEEQMKMPQRP